MYINLDVVEHLNGDLFIKLSDLYYPLSKPKSMEAKGRKIPDGQIVHKVGNLRGRGAYIEDFFEVVDEMEDVQEVEDYENWVWKTIAKTYP